MKAVKVKIDESFFLFPDGFDFPFPDYVIEHLPMIRAYIKAGEDMVHAMVNYGKEDTTEIQKRLTLLKAELAEFRARTGVIGVPFDMRDVNLFVIDRGIDVTAEIDLTER